MSKVDFENLGSEFSEKANHGQPISRCDWLEINGKQVRFIEDTHLTHPRNPVSLWKEDVFQRYVRENVCKMWGSFAVWQWARATKHSYLPALNKRPELVFVLRFPSLDGAPRLARSVRHLIDTLRQFRNGAFAQVLFIEEN